MKQPELELQTMQPTSSGEKHATCAERKNMQSAQSAGKHATGAERGKTCNRRQVRENMRPAPSAGKHATGANRGKTCDQRKRGKTPSSSVTSEVGCAPD